MKNTVPSFLLLSCIQIIFFISCQKYPTSVESVLNKAGINRIELEEVLEHYKNINDEQKYQAACFLISNMEGKYSEYYCYNKLSYELYIKNKDNIKINPSKFRLNLKSKIDSLKTFNSTQPLIVYDLDVITAKYLIENIEFAFHVWQEPWANHFSFNEFCEYILPYRVLTEPLSDWRKNFLDKYYWIKDSVKNNHDTQEIALYINDLIGSEWQTLDVLELPYPSITLLEKAKGGGCNQRYLTIVAILRAMGVPAMIDYAPQNNSSFKEHSWTVYKDSLHRFHPFDGGDHRRRLFKKELPRSAFPENMLVPLADGFASNVFRYTYSIDPNSLGAITNDWSTIPKFFRTNNLKNVTAEYEFSQQSICQKINKHEIKNNIIYLAVFGYGKSLRVADWSPIINGKVLFNNLGTGIAYLLCTYNKGKLTPISDPIILERSKKNILHTNLKANQKLILTRKCKITPKMQGFANSMVGSVFQASNNKNFNKIDTLFKVIEVPEFYIEKNIGIEKKYQYVRFSSPEKDIHIAEIQFFEKTDKDCEVRLNGQLLWHIVDHNIYDSHPINAVDDDIRTNFNASQGSWIGYDFGRPSLVTKIRYLPRNNFNIIEKGNKYELYYFDTEWKSLGVKVAENQYLKYNSVPSNTLFLLKNLTQGKEERIFTYKDGKQIWW